MTLTVNVCTQKVQRLISTSSHFVSSNKLHLIFGFVQCGLRYGIGSLWEFPVPWVFAIKNVTFHLQTLEGFDGLEPLMKDFLDRFAHTRGSLKAHVISKHIVH